MSEVQNPNTNSTQQQQQQQQQQQSYSDTKINLVLKNKMLAISEIIIASAIFLGIVYWEVKFLYTKTTVAK